MGRHLAHVCVLSIIAMTGSAWGQQYSLTPLPFLPTAINASGQVVGIQRSNVPVLNTVLPMLWTPGPGGGSTVQLPIPEGNWSGFPNAINAAGQVAGSVQGSDVYAQYPALWTPAGNTHTLTNLGSVPQANESPKATGINDAGRVIGSGWDFGNGGFASFFWEPDTPNGTSGTLIYLAGGGGTSVAARGINSAGQLAVQSGNSASLFQPVTPQATSGTFHPLPALPGGSGAGSANAINSSGQIAGTSNVGSTAHAFLWTPDSPNSVTGSILDLGDLPGDLDESRGNALNAAGFVVGESGTFFNSEGGEKNAFLWTPTGGLQNLNLSLDGSAANWTLNSAVGINDTNWIIGFGTYDPDGPGGAIPLTRQGFVITPIPEPATCLLVAPVALALLARRKKSSVAR